MDKPIVSAVNGEIGGAGLTLALLTDVVVIERQITIKDAHVLVGSASSSGPFIWPRSIGLMRAKRYILTGEVITADEAERIGLVSEVVDTGKSVERAMVCTPRSSLASDRRQCRLPSVH